MNKEKEILSLFHHTHHFNGKHEVHHCGGKHVLADPKVNYAIKHCACGKHQIDKEFAIGHATDANLKPKEVKIKFRELCPHGGWHVESGIKVKSIKEEKYNIPVMFFPTAYKKALMNKTKNTTVRIGAERGKYQNNKTYQAASYNGNLWDIKIKIEKIISTEFADLPNFGIPNRSINAIKRKEKLKAHDKVDLIKFKIL